MTFVNTIAPIDAEGLLAEMYDQDRRRFGFVTNHAQALSGRPDAISAFRALARSISTNMEPRRFELVTFAAARALRSTYCAVSHGRALRQLGCSDDDLIAIATDHHDAELSDIEAALMDFAERVARAAPEVTAADIEVLRTHGLTDTEILDVVLTVGLRCFYSTVLDALGAQADVEFRSLDDRLLDVLTVGRPISS